MKGKRYTTKEKKRMLRQADKLLGIEILQKALEKNCKSPGHKRQVAQRLVARGQCSMRMACRYFRLYRSIYAYRAKPIRMPS